MIRDLEQEKQELLLMIQKNIDPDLRKLLAAIAAERKEPMKVKVVTSTEGTSDASSK
jgi:putative aminopeptidase FrvX